MLLTLTIPDRAGEALDAWLPGWERFLTESQQMLRVLKSGSQPLPEEFLLGGILENELERWLMPLLTEPAVVNVVHDGVASLEGLPGASSERLAKALSQIKRGKPKKEIVRPPYAGELLWACVTVAPARPFAWTSGRRRAAGSLRRSDSAVGRACALPAAPSRVWRGAPVTGGVRPHSGVR